jgi:hypothetical protein
MPSIFFTQPLPNQHLITNVVVIGTDPTPLSSKILACRVCTILADEYNTTEVRVMSDPNSPLESGFPLKPGAAITLTINDLKKVWLRSSAAGQKVYFLAEA